jgi:hypothetical protein
LSWRAGVLQVQNLKLDELACDRVWQSAVAIVPHRIEGLTPVWVVKILGLYFSKSSVISVEHDRHTSIVPKRLNFGQYHRRDRSQSADHERQPDV